MKRWRCSVCGHIHIGDDSINNCPICSATWDKFILIDEESENSSLPNSSLPTDTVTEADIVVVGTGGAGLTAAIIAKEMGLEVLVIEKAKDIGGTTARSGGGLWIPNNRHQREAGIVDSREDCIHYMARYSYPNLYNPKADMLGLPEREYSVICAHYDNASDTISFLENCGAIESIMQINWTGKPQVDYMDHLPENKGIRGRTIFIKDDEGKEAMGVDLIKSLHNWTSSKDIPIFVNHEVSKIIKNSKGEVVGVEAISENNSYTFRARKGVIFASGGYSHNPELMLRLQRGPHYGGCSVPSTTGDFIKLAASEGAAIANTAGAFRAQSILELALEEPSGSNNLFYLPGDSMVLVNKYGKRTLNEKRNYTDRAMTHFVWDPVKAEWSNMIQFLVYDSRTANLWQGFPPYPVGDTPAKYIVKADTLEELANEFSNRLSSIGDHTGNFSLDQTFLENIKETFSVFNEYAKTGKDLDFARGDYSYDREWTTTPPTIPNVKWPEDDSKNYTMYPLSEEGPYYGILLAAGTLDTNGGPLIDDKARVLDWDENPIAGLYGVGNCIASPTANAYWGAGATIGPGMSFAYLAVRDAATKGNKSFE